MRSLAVIICLVIGILFADNAQAEVMNGTSKGEESIYFLLVRPFYNGDLSNDVHVNTQDQKRIMAVILKESLRRSII